MSTLYISLQQNVCVCGCVFMCVCVFMYVCVFMRGSVEAFPVLVCDATRGWPVTAGLKAGWSGP